jgi:hypothetical protein
MCTRASWLFPIFRGFEQHDQASMRPARSTRALGMQSLGVQSLGVQSLSVQSLGLQSLGAVDIGIELRRLATIESAVIAHDPDAAVA